MQPRIKVNIRVHPPKQHSGPKGKPDGGSNELKLAQAKDYLEPAPYGAHKAEPIEPHHGHEYYRNRPHFPYQFSAFVISIRSPVDWITNAESLFPFLSPQ